MPNTPAIPLFWVWGVDHIAYGPFELPTLVTWIKQRKAGAESWVFVQEAGHWCRASEITELKMFFAPKGGAAPMAGSEKPPASAAGQVRPENLRRIRIFAEMETRQLESLLGYMELERVRKFTLLFHKGAPADAMYFILEGEVRAFAMIEGKETTLFTMGAGDSFGEIALLIQGPRSSDVSANEDSLLLKLPSSAFEKIIREAPALATPFLLAMARVITNRSLEMGRKYESSIRSARATAELRF